MMRAECRRSSETGSAGKTQDRDFEKAAKFTDFLPFSVRGSASWPMQMQNRTRNIYLLASPRFSHPENRALQMDVMLGKGDERTRQRVAPAGEIRKSERFTSSCRNGHPSFASRSFRRLGLQDRGHQPPAHQGMRSPCRPFQTPASLTPCPPA